jgi:hypothetical protein
LLEKKLTAPDQIDLDKYLMICEQLGEEPDPERMPIEEYMFPTEVQLAFVIHALMPDRWDGMSGSYLGKDWSPLGALLDINEVDDKKQVTYFLKYIDVYYSEKINKDLETKRQREESKAQALDNTQGIHVQG